MRFQSIVVALSAITAAAACPTKDQSTTQNTASDTETTDSTSEDTSTSTTTDNVLSSSSTNSSSTGSSSTGEATFYGGNLSGGTCSFTTMSSLPSGLYGTAYSGSAWDSAAQCGACVSVTGPNGNSITAMIVDQCPECEATHLDLFQDAFAEIGDISDGIIDISFEFVDCGISTPLILHNKSGTSAYWFSMQVVNANGPVESLEVSTDGGSTWESTTRTDYNFFENSSGFGTETVNVRVTGANGEVVTVEDVSVSSESSTTAGGNI